MPLARQGPTKIAGVEVVLGGRGLTELEKVRMEKKRIKRELIDLYNRDPTWSGPLKGNKVAKVTFAKNPVLKCRYIALPIVSAAITHTPKHTRAATTIQKYWRRHQVFNELYSTHPHLSCVLFHCRTNAHTTSKRRYITHEIISPGMKLDSTFDAQAWGLAPAFHEAGCD